jgi:hypothetical protein
LRIRSLEPSCPALHSTLHQLLDRHQHNSTKHARCLFTVHPAAAAVLTAAQSSSAAWSFLHIENELLDIVLLMLGSHWFTCGSAHLLQLTLNKGGGRRGLCTEGVLDCGADGGSNNRRR